MKMNQVLLKYKNINCFTESIPFFLLKTVYKMVYEITVIVGHGSCCCF